MPAPSPNWTGDESQLPHWPTATFSTSAPWLGTFVTTRTASINAVPINDRMPTIATSSVDLLRRDVRRLDGPSPYDSLGVDARRKILRAVANQSGPGLAEALLHRRSAHRYSNRLMQLCDDRGRRAG